MFMYTLLIIVQTKSQQKYNSKLWIIFMMKYSILIRKNEFYAIQVKPGVGLKNIMLGERCLIQNNAYGMLPFT